MSRAWNWKAIIDASGKELWDTSESYRADIIRFGNEIQDDIAELIPAEFFRHKLKKMLPTEQDEVSLEVQKPTLATNVIAAGGSLTNTTLYKVYITFVIYDGDTDNYIESQLGAASAAATATAVNKTLTITAIDLYDGSTSIEPTTIYRNVYVSKKATTDDDYGEPFFSAQITDNTTTTASVTTEPTSTITPPSDSEIDHVTSDAILFESSSKRLDQVDKNRLIRSNPSGSESATPSQFDFIGTHRIYLYPKLISTATDAQRTLSYQVIRRPHEAFYDVSRKVDLPMSFRRAIMQGIRARGYFFEDRNGKITEYNLYEKLRDAAILKLARQRGKPKPPRDVSGDTMGQGV